ncbi:DUF4336 domain-containing protein [Hyphococcus luteus]|uniref:DUF4336 domain-containing protein n=1 Tax=Hyphococcus luteus TaxID=2058213 RepID=A0A2S7JZ14_9PROT|nr:DUF4336 domain-containing protein [Marinicaulis flavus]PQA85490.1 DUF4336 domain-containing protein [Marinicaulis flavus]
MTDSGPVERLSENIWLAEGGIVDFYGFPYPTRSVIVRLPGGALWIWSPIELTPDLREAVEALGAPAHLVSPNKIHHLFLGEWKDAYPQAKLWGPASTIKKRKDLSFEAPLDNDPPADWDGAFEMQRFTGSRFMDEIAFFHKESRTAIFADLSENFSEAFLKEHWSWWARPIARLWKIVEGYGYAPLEWRLSFNKKTARAAKENVIAWNPERVIMAHGEWIRENGQAYLKQAFAWL